MSIRNLDKMFNPRSVAVIGASDKPKSVGAALMDNMLRAGYRGPVLPVNPRATATHGIMAYKDIASLPMTPELAVIATPPDTIAPLVAELGARGTRAAVILTAGFAEGEAKVGKERAAELLAAARPHLLRVVGPNCLGLAVPGIGLDATFAPAPLLAGNIAFLTQSGAMATTVLDWALPRGIGFSAVVSMGDMADVDFGDLLDYFALDEKTEAILLYAEAVTHARKFMSAARRAARVKPVIVVKGGRAEAGARAATSHTGALAGADVVYEAAFRRAGMLRVNEVEELFDAATTLARYSPQRGNRLAIVTNGGGAGVLATDRLIEEGGRLAALSPATIAKLDAVLPATWSHGNPIDIIGDADAARYAKALTIVMDDDDIDAAVVLYCPTAVASAADAAKGVVSVLKPRARRRRTCSPAGWARQAWRKGAPRWWPRACRTTRRRSAPCAPSCIWCATGRARNCCWRRPPPSRRARGLTRTRRGQSCGRRWPTAANGWTPARWRRSLPATAFPSRARKQCPTPRPPAKPPPL